MSTPARSWSASSAEGELSYVRASDCEVRPYPAGTVFLEPGTVHTAFNQGTDTITVVGTFFDVAPGEALATPVDLATQLRLDDKCNIPDRAAVASQMAKAACNGPNAGRASRSRRPTWT